MKNARFPHQSNKNLTLTSFEISKLIAETGYPHSAGEKLILPALKIVANNLCGIKEKSLFSAIPLSNNTVKRRIDDCAKHLEEELVAKVKKSKFFSLQIDDSTDIEDNANLMCFIRYIDEDTIQESFFFCKRLPTRTTSDEIFKATNDFVTSHGIDWMKCVGLSSDGARAMAGCHKGLFKQIQELAINCVWVHCSIHKQALAVKRMPLNLNMTLEECVKFVNYIKSRPLNSRLFTELCKEMGSDHKHLLLYCNSRWLSKGNVLKRLFELKDEALVFLNEHPPSKKDAVFPFKDRFHDFKWLLKVAYLCDIFATFNELNLNLQGFGLNIFKVLEKVAALIKKMTLWKQRLSKGNFKSFETLHKFIETHSNHDEEDLHLETLSVSIQEHLSELINSFKDYFPDILSNNMWIKDPFSVEMEKEEMLNLSEQEVDNLIEISCDTDLKKVFETVPLINFWLRCQKEYPSVSEKAIEFLMPFVTTYTCEAAFSTLVYLKNKYRNRLDVEPNLRIKLTPLLPNLKLLCDDKQHHPSH